MIEKLKLTNFRKHEDLVLDFTRGLNVVRGGNEQGKSTLQESIGYALFGSKALRTNFADAVTWGRGESTLKVALTLILGERKLTFARGKSGAEVLEDGRVIVTGQTEVSTYAANLLGCDGTAAANLMIASQNAMRGSLEQGPKATAAMIEQLADFDLFDTLIERIQTQLIVGAPATFEQRVTDAQAQIDAFVPAPAPDDAGHTAWLLTNAAAVGDLRGAIDNELQPAYRDAEKARDDVVALTKACDEAADELEQAARTLSGHLVRHAQLTQDAENLRVGADELASASASLKDLTEAAGAGDAYAVFKALPACAHEFDESVEEFAVWLEGRRSTLASTVAARSSAVTRIEVLQAGLVSASVCGFCGQDVSAFPDVAQKNAEAETAIDTYRRELTGYTSAIEEITAEITTGKTIETAALRVNQALPYLQGRVNINTTFTPSRVTWRGEPPTAVDLTPATALVARLEAQAVQALAAEAKASVLAEVLIEDSAAVERARGKVANYQRPADPGALHQAYIDAQQACWNAESNLQVLKNALDDRREEFNNTVAVFNARKGEHERLEGAVVKARADLEDLAFNNLLLKKVRAARPIIADKLWNTVLAAVSVMFSQMRGEPSLVSKDSSGFKVNGQPVESLSGSSLDILGLALRTALVKTFIPHAQFMLLDEAAAACDEDRTGALLGFIAGSGFDQVLLVTHESMSTGVADNVIEI